MTTSHPEPGRTMVRLARALTLPPDYVPGRLSKTTGRTYRWVIHDTLHYSQVQGSLEQESEEKDGRCPCASRSTTALCLRDQSTTVLTFAVRKTCLTAATTFFPVQMQHSRGSLRTVHFLLTMLVLHARFGSTRFSGSPLDDRYSRRDSGPGAH